MWFGFISVKVVTQQPSGEKVSTDKIFWIKVTKFRSHHQSNANKYDTKKGLPSHWWDCLFFITRLKAANRLLLPSVDTEIQNMFRLLEVQPLELHSGCIFYENSKYELQLRESTFIFIVMKEHWQMHKSSLLFVQIFPQSKWTPTDSKKNFSRTPVIA